MKSSTLNQQVDKGFNCFLRNNTDTILVSCSSLLHTDAGKLMARFCVAFDTMKQFYQVTGTENLSDLVNK